LKILICLHARKVMSMANVEKKINPAPPQVPKTAESPAAAADMTDSGSVAHSSAKTGERSEAALHRPAAGMPEAKR
jgi:hypothetical protein